MERGTFQACSNSLLSGVDFNLLVILKEPKEFVSNVPEIACCYVFEIEADNESLILFLSDDPIDEPMAQYRPYADFA